MVKSIRLGDPGGEHVPLDLDMFPRTAVAKSLKEVLESESWDIARKRAYQIAGYACQHCGKRMSDGVAVYAIPLWQFEEESVGGYSVQRLTGIISVCSECFALRRMWPGLEEAVPRLAEAWEVSCEEAYQRVMESERLAEERSLRLWALDLMWLEDRGISSAVKDPCTRVIRDGVVMGEA